MGGIVGCWNVNGLPVDQALLRHFAHSLSHRGPTEQAIRIDAEHALGLGNTHLAIGDLAATGSQPMKSADDMLWITFDGEIYNFAALRQELQAFGHLFTAQSDAEVVLAAYRQWGAACQHKLNGVWAFAIWDRRAEQLFLSRDRFGVKSLYYFFDGTHFAFASELKAFLRLTWFDREPNWALLTTSLSNRHYLHGIPQTYFARVQRLLAGHALLLEKRAAPRLWRWWHTLAHLPTIPQSFAEQAAMLRDLLADACQLQGHADQPLAVSLSSGLDSSAILATLCKQGQKPTAAYIAQFRDPFYDESKLAAQLTDRLAVKAVHAPISFTVALDEVDRILFHAEDVRTLHLGNWRLFQAMHRDGIPLALTGDGSDELFTGVAWHEFAAVAGVLPPRFYGEGSGAKTSWWQRLWQGSGARHHYARMAAAFQPSAAYANPLVGSELLTGVGEAIDYSCFGDDLAQLLKEDFLKKQPYYDFHSGSLPWVLHLKDMLSRAHGVELRFPFLDWRLVTFAFALPTVSLVDKQFIKRVVREAVREMVPDPIRLKQSKIAFVNSERSAFWQMKPLILAAINERAFLDCPLWHGRYLRQCIEKAYQQGDAPQAEFFWKCVKTSRLLHTLA